MLEELLFLLQPWANSPQKLSLWFTDRPLGTDYWGWGCCSPRFSSRGRWQQGVLREQSLLQGSVPLLGREEGSGHPHSLFWKRNRNLFSPFLTTRQQRFLSPRDRQKTQTLVRGSSSKTHQRKVMVVLRHLKLLLTLHPFEAQAHSDAFSWS